MALLEVTALDRALDRVCEGRTPGADEAAALLDTPSARMPALLAAAAAIRDRGHGRRITFSAKVFVPLTTLCRDYCGYCTFRKDPGEPSGSAPRKRSSRWATSLRRASPSIATSCVASVTGPPSSTFGP